MKKVKFEDRKKMAPLFEGLEDSMVIAYLQGYMGDGYVDRMPNPRVGLIVSAEYCFFGGDSSLPEATELAEKLFDTTSLDEMLAIYVEKETGWFDILMSQEQNRPESLPRFGIVQRDYDFDVKKLETIASQVSDGLELVPFDENLYHQAMSESWSREFLRSLCFRGGFFEARFWFCHYGSGAACCRHLYDDRI